MRKGEQLSGQHPRPHVPPCSCFKASKKGMLSSEPHSFASWAYQVLARSSDHQLSCMQAFAAVSGSGSASLVLLLTELTGLYAISTVLLIRKQLPLKYRCAHLSALSQRARCIGESSMP